MGAQKDFELQILIAGKVDKTLGEALKLAKKEVHEFSSEDLPKISKAVDSMSSGIDSITDCALGIAKTVVGAAVGAGAALGGMGVAAVNAGSDFESAFAGIRKTVDATEQQYSQLEDGIREMARNIPMTAIELSEIGESAGQLGIHTENLEDFIRTMADLSVATNLTSEEGAADFAKFANITGMAQDQFSNLGSAVVDLGNHMATTEADIVSMGMRLAGAGAQVGMSEADIMGFAAALSSVGIEAEAGGSAMSKMMVNMQLAVEKGLGASGAAAVSLKEFADVAGMSSKEFAAAFKEDAAKALGAFVSGLNDTDRLGKSAVAILDSMDIKEVRLRDTLLRAANASELFNEAIDRSNAAFEANTALAKEAEQRYATFESRLQVLQNRITDLGITFYQDFKEPLNDVLGLVLDETADWSLFDPDTMREMADAAREYIPTVIRHVREGANVFTDFVGPLAGTVVNNLDLIGSGIIGIGTSIVALNVIKKINDLGKAFGAMKVAMIGNPWTAVIAGASVAVGAIAAVKTKMELVRKEAKESNLDRHFGTIALSMEELGDAAEQIVKNENLDKINQALAEMDKAADIARNIRSTSKEIEKMSWKIGSGFELDRADTDDLKASIDSMVEDALSLVQQSNYTASVSVQALFGTDSSVGDGLIAGFDEMYAQINSEVYQLGRQLGDAYSNAMEDGIIDLDEARAINELQGKLATITEEISQSQFEAKMRRLQLQYDGTDLTVESFQNLQAEIQEVLAEQSANQSQSFEYALGQLNLQFSRSQRGEIDPDDAAYLSKQAYEEAKRAIEEQFSSQQMELKLKGLTFSTDSIEEAYRTELGELEPVIQQGMQDVMQNAMAIISMGGNGALAFEPKEIQKALEIDALDQATRDAVRELWDGAMKTQFEELQALAQQAQNEGRAVPEAVSKGLSDAAAIGAIAGDAEALWQIMADSAAGNEEYEEALKAAEGAGYQLPESIRSGIHANQPVVETAVQELYDHVQEITDQVFSEGVTAAFDIYIEPNYIEPYDASAKLFGSMAVKPKAHAVGGIMREPHIGLVAEAGPEAIIPLDGSEHAKSIWKEAGRELGINPDFRKTEEENSSEKSFWQKALEAFGISIPKKSSNIGLSSGAADGQHLNSETEQQNTGAGDTYYITYSPVLQGASEEVLSKISRDSFEEFKRYMERYRKESRRLAFSSNGVY